MFTVLTVVYDFIILISLYGDYKSKEIEKDKEDWKKIFDRSYY